MKAIAAKVGALLVGVLVLFFAAPAAANAPEQSKNEQRTLLTGTTDVTRDIYTVTEPPQKEPVQPDPQPEPTVDPLQEWFENPTFTCEEGYAPGWLDENGHPTSCVAN